MKRLAYGMALSLVVLLLAGMPLRAQEAEDPITRIDSFLHQLADRGLLSGAFLMARDGEVLYSGGYGMANLDWDIPNTVDTRFRIASISKQFTAMSILLLQEQGKLDIHDPLCTYIEDCPEAWADVTLEHLMNHTSGINDFVRESMMQPRAVNRQVADLKTRPLSFQPGEGWQYSNAGYIVLGHVIQEVSGQSYQRFLQEHIFDPLGMANSGYDDQNRVIKNRATGYASTTRLASYLDMSIPHAAGALYSTVGDLNIWINALMDGEVVPGERLDAMWESAVLMPPVRNDRYGYGLASITLAGHRAIGHDGGINGFVSRLSYFPDDDVTIITLSNFESSAVGQVVESAARILFDAG